MKLILIRLVILVAVILAWEFASGALIAEFFISKPSKVADVLGRWISNGDLFYHAAITAFEAFLGFLLGAAVGIAVGLLLGRAKRLAEVLDPFIMAFYSLPKLALAPLFILWFGIGLEMKIVLTATICFFLVFLNTYTGVRSVSREMIAILKLMGAKEGHVVTKVVIPSAITWVFAGLRISVPYALIGAVVGELMASNRGLGFLLSSAAGDFNTAGVFAALVAIVALAALLNYGVSVAARIAMPWERTTEKREFSI
ncbi:ABC transporter permease [Celeribacter indicus]|uniref:Binding-protein-dependent transport system inner membrane protein n=1 Tax=Celeribacter indicus TaxID=1208324 RepID=A0A0B5E0H1_9RHOB|nr:ABC transporter permease [Celeribacter indicus]AJE49148.1 binding-protein-dependent transport system inner membrane protein [Celeribacter indicus]SDX17591.1 NitT/TauT family transport system permease protein [Celeribacter indicus]